MNFTRTVRCVDAAGQPRLSENATYKVIVEVEQGKVFSGDEEKEAKGFIVMNDFGTVIPYVYNRNRFSELQESVEGEGVAD